MPNSTVVPKLVSVLFLFALAGLFAAGCSASSAQSVQETQPKDMVFKNTIVTLTFDDGDADNYAVRDDLRRNHLQATFYVVSSFIGTNGYMSLTQLQDLDSDGNEIGGHSLSHADLIELHGPDLKREVCQDRENLLAYGFDIVSFAYPSGHLNDEVKQTVKECGYAAARVVVEGPQNLPVQDPYELRAMPYIVNDTRLSKITRYIRQTESDGGGWVIFVFHHVCDGCDYFAVSPDTFSKLTDWLGHQKENGLDVRAVRDVISMPGFAAGQK